MHFVYRETNKSQNVYEMEGYWSSESSQTGEQVQFSSFVDGRGRENTRGSIAKFWIL